MSTLVLGWLLVNLGFVIESGLSFASKQKTPKLFNKRRICLCGVLSLLSLFLQMFATHGCMFSRGCDQFRGLGREWGGGGTHWRRLWTRGWRKNSQKIGLGYVLLQFAVQMF